MNNSYIDQITLDCLINKENIGKHIMKEREKQINNDDLKFYRKRIFNLFKTITYCNLPIDLSPDVKYAHDTFIKSSINYFKVTDNNDLLQEEYKDINNSLDNNDLLQEEYKDINNSLDNNDLSCNLLNIEDNNNADILLMRSIKVDLYTLDKYVKRTSIKKNETIIFPKQREINLTKPELKNKGIKKNITNKYENNNTKKEDK
jgi:hypothetical protein